jgi:hypothetical protein
MTGRGKLPPSLRGAAGDAAIHAIESEPRVFGREAPGPWRAAAIHAIESVIASRFGGAAIQVFCGSQAWTATACGLAVTMASPRILVCSWKDLAFSREAEGRRPWRVGDAAIQAWWLAGGSQLPMQRRQSCSLMRYALQSKIDDQEFSSQRLATFF